MMKLNTAQRRYVVDVLKNVANVGAAVFAALGWAADTYWVAVAAALWWVLSHAVALWVLVYEDPS